METTTLEQTSNRDRDDRQLAMFGSAAVGGALIIAGFALHEPTPRIESIECSGIVNVSDKPGPHSEKIARTTHLHTIENGTERTPTNEEVQTAIGTVMVAYLENNGKLPPSFQRTDFPATYNGTNKVKEPSAVPKQCTIHTK